MTLDTEIYIYNRVDHKTTYRKVNELLGIPETVIFKDGTGEPYGCVPCREVSNAPMQGFNAWVMTYSNGDGIGYTDEYIAEQIGYAAKYPDDYPDFDPKNVQHPAGPHFMQISMDTSYGYRGDNGWGCTELHASVIVRLGLWLEQQNVRWAWKNEYTGEIHQGFDGLDAFIGHGEEAGTWFKSLAMN